MAWRATVWITPEEHRVVGKVLADFRKKAGLRQQDLAARLSKPQSFVSSYEAGQRRIDVLELLRIAASMEADPKEVFAAIARQHGVKAGGG